MVLELVSGADFRCVLHHFSSLTCLKGSWGQVWPESGPKPKLKFRFQFPNRSLTQFRFHGNIAGSCSILGLEPQSPLPRGRNKGLLGAGVRASISSVLRLRRFNILILAPPPSPEWGPGGGSRLSFSFADWWFWADSGPDPGGNLF